MDLTHRWDWQPTINWALDRCEVCGEQAAGRLSGDLETLVFLGGRPHQFLVGSVGAYSCADHLAEVVELVEQRGQESIGNARRAAEHA